MGRAGLNEMRRFSRLLYPSVREETFGESCGIADLIATCYGGRNRRVAEVFAKEGGRRSFSELESELLRGQKLQGALTSDEVQAVLATRGWIGHFPLFSVVNDIVNARQPPQAIVKTDFRKTGINPA